MGLPLLTRGQRRGADPHVAEENAARIAAAQAAIRAIDDEQRALTSGDDQARAAVAADVSARLMDAYRRRIAKAGGEEEQRREARVTESVEVQMRAAAMR